MVKKNPVEENEKPMLKALIKIKAENREFNLEQIYNMHKDMFTKENCWRNSMNKNSVNLA